LTTASPDDERSMDEPRDPEVDDSLLANVRAARPQMLIAVTLESGDAEEGGAEDSGSFVAADIRATRESGSDVEGGTEDRADQLNARSVQASSTKLGEITTPPIETKSPVERRAPLGTSAVGTRRETVARVETHPIGGMPGEQHSTIARRPPVPASSTGVLALHGGSDQRVRSRVDTERPSVAQSPAGVYGHTLEEHPVELPALDNMLVHETGRFDDRAVQRVVSQHKRSVASCYDRSLKVGGSLDGRLEIEISVLPTGYVSSAENRSPAFQGTELARCVSTTMRQWRFPPFAGEPVLVSVPFLFHARL
jgi:hypothetical protein